MGAKLATLTEAFAGNTLDATRWTVTAGTPQVARGQLTGAIDATSMVRVDSAQRWDLTGSQFTFRFGVPVLAVDLEAVTELADDASNSVQMTVDGVNPGALRLRVVRGGVTDETRLDYDPAQHAYGRIRENAGHVYFDTSADGLNFVNRRVVVHGLDLRNVTVTMRATAAPLFERLIDAFDGPLLDPQWSAAQVLPLGGALRLTSQAHLSTAAAYPLTGAGVVVKMNPGPPPASGGVAMTGMVLTAASDPSKSIDIYFLENELWVDGETFYTTTGWPYDPATTAYLRIRQDTTTTYWEVGPDGSTWTEIASSAVPTVGLAWSAFLYVQTYNGLADPWYVDFDDFSFGSLVDGFDVFPSSSDWDLGGHAALAGGAVSVIDEHEPLSGFSADSLMQSLGSRWLYTSHLMVQVGPVLGFIEISDPGVPCQLRFTFDTSTSAITASVTSDPDTRSAVATYDPAAMAFVRFRQDQAGLVYLETSPDAATWTVLLASVVALPPMMDGRVYFATGDGVSASRLGQMQVDGVNVISASAPFFSDVMTVLRPSDVTATAGDPVSGIPDASTAGNPVTTTGTAALYVAGVTPLGTAAIEFTTGTGVYRFPTSNQYLASTSGEVFAVVRVTTSTTADNPGFYQFGHLGADRNYYPFVDGACYEQAFASARVSFPGVSVTDWHVYNVSHDGTTRVVRIDNTPVHTAAVPFVQPTDLLIGPSADATSWHGQIAEFVAYTRALTAAERASVYAYLRGRHLGGA